MLEDRCPLGDHVWRGEVDFVNVAKLVQTLGDLAKQGATYIQLEIDAPEH